ITAKNNRESGIKDRHWSRIRTQKTPHETTRPTRNRKRTASNETTHQRPASINNTTTPSSEQSTSIRAIYDNDRKHSTSHAPVRGTQDTISTAGADPPSGSI